LVSFCLLFYRYSKQQPPFLLHKVKRKVENKCFMQFRNEFEFRIEVKKKKIRIKTGEAEGTEVWTSKMCISVQILVRLGRDFGEWWVTTPNFVHFLHKYSFEAFKKKLSTYQLSIILNILLHRREIRYFSLFSFCCKVCDFFFW
jgi:hypothetical protein